MGVPLVCIKVTGESEELLATPMCKIFFVCERNKGRLALYWDPDPSVSVGLCVGLRLIDEIILIVDEKVLPNKYLAWLLRWCGATRGSVC